VRLLAAAALIAVAVAAAGCGGGSDGSSGGGAERVELMLDFFPNADHAPIYAAQAGGDFKREGLDVSIRTPSDPSAPLKLLAAGRADLAISYEPEVLRARDKGLPVVAVGSLVRTPLTAIVSLPRTGIHSPADLRGKTVGTAGIDYQTAYLHAVAPSPVKEMNVGFDLVPALVSGKVDAVLGAYWNYEAIQLRQKGRSPNVIRIDRAGVPTYDELVITANERDVRQHPERIRRFLAGLAAGVRALKADPEAGIRPLLAANRTLDPGLQRASVKVTFPYFSPATLDPRAWRAFTAFMHRNGLLKISTPAGAYTNRLLPASR
jgi:putative hydroxymethylpyrimidine transport system substrate-binding protein